MYLYINCIGFTAETITLLSDLGVEEIGAVINKCPYLLATDTKELKDRILYLSRQRFARQQVIEIMEKCPRWFCETIEEIDGRLGAIQRLFGLSGNLTLTPRLVSSVAAVFHSCHSLPFLASDVRRMASRCPRLVLWNVVKLKVSPGAVFYFSLHARFQGVITN